MGRERAGRSRGRRGKQVKKDEEDRISQLSDDLIINHILPYVHSKVAVQTTVLSKRWRNLWTTIPCLNFKRPVSGDNENFVKKFLENRDQQHVLKKFTIDCYRGGSKMLITCLDYAVSHNVEHLSIRNGDFAHYPCKINFTGLRTLHLMWCKNSTMMHYWNLRSLTSLYLEAVIGDQILGFENLKELTLVERKNAGRFDLDTITINCPKLESLTLNLVDEHTLIVSAPSLCYFSYCSRYVSAFCAGDGFPCIKQVYIDIRKKNDYFFEYYSNRLVMQNFIFMLKAVSETPFLELSSETIERLRMIQRPDLSEYKHCSLGNLKFLSLRGPGQFDMQPPWITNVVNYLLTNSPCAKIIRRL